MLNLAVLQFKPSLGKVEENLSKVLSLLGYVKEGSVVALPEMWFCGFDYDNLKSHAERTEEVLEEIKKISLQKDLTIIGTYPLKGKEGIYNCALVVEEGKIIGKRHKIKLFPLYEEEKHFKSGKDNTLIESKRAKIGVLICFELRFSSLLLRDAELLVVPSMWGKKRREHLEVLSRSRTIENQSFLLLSNVWGKVGQEEYAGSSAIYSPWGEVLAYSEKGDSLLQVEVEKEQVYVVRRYMPLF
ncbi:MAG: carbon-nitrogen hydrolase family protein [Aquificaceae bacterium]